MEHQNITLSLSKDLLKQARHLAVEKGTSLSKLLSDYLEQLVLKENRYQQAADRIRKRLNDGIDLGTGGKCTWMREDLHERVQASMLKE